MSKKDKMHGKECDIDDLLKLLGDMYTDEFIMANRLIFQILHKLREEQKEQKEKLTSVSNTANRALDYGRDSGMIGGGE